VLIYPEQCTMNGVFTAYVTAECHPLVENCLHPSPDDATIVMTITSDDFCGHSQVVEVTGTLNVLATECNEYMFGSVFATAQGDLNMTNIERLRASPALLGAGFYTVYDEDLSILNLDYSATPASPNQVDFSFLWRGDIMRCDVLASIEVRVGVEYQATRNLGTFSVEGEPATKTALLQIGGGSDANQEMHLSASAAVSDSNGGSGGSDGGDGSSASALGPNVLTIACLVASYFAMFAN